jgi:hypothetical protein
MMAGMKRMTKVQKVWRERYESARHVMTGFNALAAANKKLEEEYGVFLSYEDVAGEALVIAKLPNGSTRSLSEVGYLTLTVQVRLTEQVLAEVKVADLEKKAH